MRILILISFIGLSSCFDFPTYTCNKKEQAKFVLACIKNMRGNDLEKIDSFIPVHISFQCKNLSQELYCREN